MNNQNGFTLIELVVVIIILGILSAVAIPKFLDLSSDARQANAEAVAGALGSANAINYAGALVKGAVIGTTTYSLDAAVANTLAGCVVAVANSLMDEGATFGAGAGEYAIAGGAPADANVGTKTTCTITFNDDANATATFTMINAD